MYGLPHSLNAATSASIAIYEYCRWAETAGRTSPQAHT
jgi:tRNA G18 (ribose-2'-O)-methylase SpoU